MFDRRRPFPTYRAATRGTRSATLFLGFAALLYLWSWGLAAAADQWNSVVESGERSRFALVIGNGAYRDSPLDSPSRDARAFADVLARAGFEVVLAVDATRREMDAAIAGFIRKLTPDSVGLVFFSGRGIEYQGHNYLVPVDVRLQRESDLHDRALDLWCILKKMRDARSNPRIAILDADRIRPIFRSGPVSDTGHGNACRTDDIARDALVAYSTMPGGRAMHEGVNSPYTTHLVKAMQQPGLPLQIVLRQVRKGVMEDTGERQIPWESSGMMEDFYFFPSAGQGTRQDDW